MVFTDEVTLAEDDDFIRIFSHHPVQQRAPTTQADQRTRIGRPA